MVELFDTHVHLNVEQFDEDLEEVIERAKEAGVKWMNVVGFDRETITKAMNLIDRYEFMYATIGWHPVDSVDMKREDLEWIESLATHDKVVAIGETGLDYHWDKSPADVQKRVFKDQIDLHKRVNLPLVIHGRDAQEDIATLLEEEGVGEAGGIMHCFSGDVATAERCLAQGMHISFGGPVTFKNAKLPKEVAKIVPLDRLLIETDCPFLSPHPYRGKRNEPARVRIIAEQLAELKGLTLEELSEITTENAKRLFRISS
ncbi:TatD family hydrolase [Geomicrobium sp. JCM 19038]|uniref:TatD family hydrolase n=1 Tax=Geomicrobium sp. JCM 19038 TaxID=1460635 RepID=UPI00045F42EA|nr:TatD family hydrolase [Geomicrobium sp. JCM 19038]GAK09969.1 putative deoxyribonuclease YcfH [Geomicrobium sp. JCM 19038]